MAPHLRLGLDCLPPGWLSFVDPESVLCFQCASRAQRLTHSAAVAYWAELCAAMLGLPPGLPSGLLPQLLTPAHGVGKASAAADSTDVEVCGAQVWQQAVRHLADLHGIELMNLNMLAAGENRDVLPPELSVEPDACGLHTICRLRHHIPLGGDRCVLAAERLPDPRGCHTARRCARGPHDDTVCAAIGDPHDAATSSNGSGFAVRNAAPTTALPRRRLPQSAEAPWVWRVGRRPLAYYEVSISDVPESKEPRRDSATSRMAPSFLFPRPQCISLGLALDSLPTQSLRMQQAGWNSHSWALHGDDGRIYHGGHGVGSSFRPLLPAARGDIPSWGAAVSPPPRFGAGDVVGCGVVLLGSNPCNVSEEFQGIFFTLNGVFLGIAFLLTTALDEPLPLRACVGVDAHWVLEFNFGTRPFAFDVDALDVSGLKAALQHGSTARAPALDSSVSRGGRSRQRSRSSSRERSSSSNSNSTSDRSSRHSVRRNNSQEPSGTHVSSGDSSSSSSEGPILEDTSEDRRGGQTTASS